MYYNEEYEERLKQKLFAKEELTEDEIRCLVQEFPTVDIEYGDNRRWCRSVYSVLQVDNRYFAVNWEEGLTEYQENYYYDQPVEVVPHTYEKVITTTVTEWEEIK